MPKKIPYRYLIVLFLFLLMFITYLDRISISLVGVRIKEDFHLNNTEFGWVVGVFSLAYILFEIPAAVFGDKKGQKTALAAIVLWWSVFTVLTGMATGFASLIIIRFLFGMGEAGAVPNATGVISRWLPAREISRAVIVSFTGQSAGAAFAPLIVIPIAMAFGWRMTFFVNGIIGLIWVIFCVLWFKNNPSEMKHISEKEKKLIEENRHFSTHTLHIPWKTMFKSKTLIAVSFAHFCSQWSNYFFIAWLPVYLQQGRHFSESSVKYIVSLIFIPTILASFPCGRLSDWIIMKRGVKFGRRLVGVLTLGTLAISFLLEANTDNNSFLVICLFSAYIFQMFFGTVSFGVCIDIGGNHAGTVSAVLNSIGQAGAFFMAIVFGRLVDLTHDFNVPLYAIAFLLMIGALLCLLIDPTKKLNLEN